MDIVLCLRSYAHGSTMDRTSTAMALEAAAEIERLRAELAEAVAALPQAVRNERERIRKALMEMHGKTSDHNYYHCAVVTLFGA